MAISLSIFTEKDAEILVSLPYKAGIWIAGMEDADGEEDDIIEMKALEACIKAVGDLHEDQPLIKAIAAETLKRRADWPAWQDESHDAPAGARKAISILKGRASEEEIKAYRAAVIEVATAVAEAFGEFSGYDPEDEGFFSRLVSKFKSLKDDDAGHPMNVGPAEDEALAELAQALKGK
jgi:hypothetical protein